MSENARDNRVHGGDIVVEVAVGLAVGDRFVVSRIPDLNTCRANTEDTSMRVSMIGIGVGAAALLVAAPAAGYSAKNTKPAEIVVVGSKLKKKGGRDLRAGDTLIERWQRSRVRPGKKKGKK